MQLRKESLKKIQAVDVGHSSIGGTELTPFLGENLIKVGGNKLTSLTS